MMSATDRRRSSPRNGTSSGPRRPHRTPNEVISAVRPIAEQIAEDLGLVLWDVAFVRDAGRETLRVSCDRVGNVDSEELASFSERLSRELDQTDAVPGEARYVLEISSPGAERKLEAPDQFAVCVGRVAKVSLRDGRTVEGAITAVTDHAVEIRTGDEEETVRVLFDDIARARLVVKL